MLDRGPHGEPPSKQRAVKQQKPHTDPSNLPGERQESAETAEAAGPTAAPGRPVGKGKRAARQDGSGSP